MYGKMVEIYSKETKEELIQQIMALNEIECSDRCFANQCFAGTSIYSINKLFSALHELKAAFTTKKAAEVYELIEDAESSWNYIMDGIEEMNDTKRYSELLKNIKSKASNINDDE